MPLFIMPLLNSKIFCCDSILGEVREENMDSGFIHGGFYGKTEIISFQYFYLYFHSSCFCTFVQIWVLCFYIELSFLLFSLSVDTLADKVVAFKSIAAYRSGLEFNTEVTAKEAEEGLKAVLHGKIGKMPMIKKLIKMRIYNYNDDIVVLPF